MESICKNLGSTIQMPEFKERQMLYMHKTKMNEIMLPNDFKEYEQTLDDILNKISDRNNVCYVTIHEKKIKVETHRRPGVHVDFNWFEKLNGPDKGGHAGQEGGHKRPQMLGKWDDRPYWSRKEIDGGGMLLVSNYEGCKVWNGKFEGEIGDGGCCKNINLSNLKSETMKAVEVFYLNALGIHESIIIDQEINRSLIRINFHPDYMFN